MGPLANGDSPVCLQAPKGKSRSKYMRGASALFAWHIAAADDVVTILCPPPPDRFNPGGGTNMQLVELPILRDIVGGHAMPRIEVVHPMVQGAEDFRYQLWPVDEVRAWIDRFAKVAIERTVWLQRSKGGPVKAIERLLRSTSRESEDDAVYRAILHEEDLGGAMSASEQSGEEHIGGGNLPATQSNTPKKKKKKKKAKAGVAIASELATASEGGQDKKLEILPEASSKKTETEAPLGTGEDASELAQGETKEANTAPQSSPKAMGTRGESVGGYSSQVRSLSKPSKTWGIITSARGRKAAKRVLGKKIGQEMTKPVETKAVSVAATNAESDGIATTSATNEAKEAKRKKKEEKRKRKEENRKKKAEKKRNKPKPRGPWMGSSKTPGQTDCCCIVCKAPRARLPTISPLLMQSKPKAKAFLNLTIQKPRVKDTVEALSRLASLSAECSRAEFCLQPARASLFIIPTASWLTLERAQGGRS